MTSLRKINMLDETVSEAHVRSFRAVALTMASEIVEDKALFDDAVQEGIIQVWKVLSVKPDATRGYVHKAMRRRIREICVRQTFTGHTGKHNHPIDPLRKPHDSVEALSVDGWEPSVELLEIF